LSRFLVVFLVLSALGQSLAPRPAEPLDSSARASFKQGQFKEAAAAYRSLIGTKPSSEAYAGLVQSLLKLDDVSAADQESQRGLEIFPQSALAHAMRGDVDFRRGLMAEADGEYAAAGKLDEKCARAWLGKGKILLATAREDQARKLFARAHELDPEDGDALYNWAALLPYPQNVTELDRHLAEFRSDRDQERREHDFVELLRHVAGRKFWVQAKPVSQTEIKMETVAPVPRMVLGAGLRVRFNDSVNATLLLDTGANWITIPRKLAEKIGARKISNYGLEGTGDSGPAAGYFAWVDKVTLGDLEFHDCLVHVSMKNDMGGIDGVVGANFLSQYLVTLDFPVRRVRLTALPKSPSADNDSSLQAATETGEAVRHFFGFGHLLLLPTQVNRLATGLFVVDTGANTSSISPDFAAQVGKLRDATPRVSGMSGQVKQVFVLDSATLRFSPAPQTLDKLIAFERRSLSKELGTEVSGFIGYDLLQRMKIAINYRDGLVEFEGK
jgi:tetratricopeptide (TPR) repeat protein